MPVLDSGPVRRRIRASDAVGGAFEVLVQRNVRLGDQREAAGTRSPGDSNSAARSSRRLAPDRDDHETGRRRPGRRRGCCGRGSRRCCARPSPASAPDRRPARAGAPAPAREERPGQKRAAATPVTEGQRRVIPESQLARAARRPAIRRTPASPRDQRQHTRLTRARPARLPAPGIDRSAQQLTAAAHERRRAHRRGRSERSTTIKVRTGKAERQADGRSTMQVEFRRPDGAVARSCAAPVIISPGEADACGQTPSQSRRGPPAAPPSASNRLHDRA